MAIIQNIAISKLVTNTGQIPGLPKNPRFIKDDRYEKLKKSIEDDPEMLELREAIVYPFGNKFVIIAANMRYRACKELGFKEMPCKVLPVDTPTEKLRAYAIKDNIGFGSDDFELLANEWDEQELSDFGMEFIMPAEEGGEGDPFNDSGITAKSQYAVIVACPDELRQIEIYKELTEAGYECKVVVV